MAKTRRKRVPVLAKPPAGFRWNDGFLFDRYGDPHAYVEEDRHGVCRYSFFPLGEEPAKEGRCPTLAACSRAVISLLKKRLSRR